MQQLYGFISPQGQIARRILILRSSECKESLLSKLPSAVLHLQRYCKNQRLQKESPPFLYYPPFFLAKSKYSSQNLWSINNYLYLCRVKCLKITIMATQVLQFNQAQQAVLNVISCLQSEQDLADLKRTLVKFMNDRLQREMDKLWESGEMSNEKLQEMQSEHLRTAYK